VTALITKAGGKPTPAAVAYELGGPANSPGPGAGAGRPDRARAAAQGYADLVAAAPGPAGRAPAAWLADAAVRAAAWSGSVEPSPGSPTTRTGA
jgi:hypothetical protein